jgi:segregation and condensation protein A
MMSEQQEAGDDWQGGEARPQRGPAAEGGALVVDVAGFEGPLDLLLDLARRQKVDLARISVLALAEQYLAFIAAAKRLQLELAADYLVMAAWLAYLKSRLLLPTPAGEEEPPPEALAARLAFRLQRLQAMREAAAQLMARNRLGREVFGRGAPEPLAIESRTVLADNLVDLLKAYAQRRQERFARRSYVLRKRPVWSINDARQVLERLIGGMEDWGRFDRWLADYMPEGEQRASAIASSFTASLELAREGRLELRQERPFDPIYMRRRSPARAVP